MLKEIEEGFPNTTLSLQCGIHMLSAIRLHITKLWDINNSVSSLANSFFFNINLFDSSIKLSSMNKFTKQQIKTTSRPLDIKHNILTIKKRYKGR